jgi:hypothetical protein
MFKFNDIPIPVIEDILNICSLDDICNFIYTSKENLKLFYWILEEKIEETDDYDLSDIRSHGNCFSKEIARKIFLERNPQLTPLNNKTIREAVELFYSNKKDCIEKFGYIELWDVSKVTTIGFNSIEFYFYPNDRYIIHKNNISRWDISRWDISNQDNTFVKVLVICQITEKFMKWDPEKYKKFDYEDKYKLI